jgi:anti-sigma regulatory factor (Ser/Thr protein kinase)
MSLQPAEIVCLASVTASGQARSLVKFRFADWGLTGRRFKELLDDVLLVATELVNNAVEATPDQEIRFRLAPERDALLVGAWDCSNDRPTARPIVELELDDLDLDPAAFDSNGGRGLPIVMALASEYGVEMTPPQGKWVWARFKLKRRSPGP